MPVFAVRTKGTCSRTRPRGSSCKPRPARLCSVDHFAHQFERQIFPAGGRREIASYTGPFPPDAAGVNIAACDQGILRRGKVHHVVRAVMHRVMRLFSSSSSMSSLVEEFPDVPLILSLARMSRAIAPGCGITFAGNDHSALAPLPSKQLRASFSLLATYCHLLAVTPCRARCSCETFSVAVGSATRRLSLLNPAIAHPIKPPRNRGPPSLLNPPARTPNPI